NQLAEVRFGAARGLPAYRIDEIGLLPPQRIACLWRVRGSMTVSLRCGLIGTGQWMRSALLPALLAQPETAVVACVGASQAEAEAFCRTTGVGQARASLADMLADAEVDLAVVATPDHVHAEDVARLLRAGVAVYCEKPLANDAPTAHELVALQQR